MTQLRRCERLIDLQRRLPAVLQGRDKPRDAAEAIQFAELCGIKGRFAAAAGLYAVALAASPRSAEDLRTVHRYTAACAAALAGRGLGEDAATLGEPERDRWRERSRAWLGAELTLWAGALDRGPEADREVVRQRLAHLWADPDLAGLRDPAVLDKMPPAERQQWVSLWSDVDALIDRPIRP